MFQLNSHSLMFKSLNFLLLIIPASIYASDLQKETRMMNQVADYVMQGDALMLADAQREFLSIYMESETLPAKGAVIIMHGRGYHPNWPQLVYPLRTGLPEHGWHTLSIQMPVLDNDASFYEYLDILPEAYPRINAAIHFLQQQKINNIILLSHSCSVHMSMDWLHKHPSAGASAYIGIGMGSTDKGQPMLKQFPLEQIKIPLLDIRGEYDYPAVIKFAPERLRLMKIAGNPKSKQTVVAKSDHDHTDQQEALLTVIARWLDTL